MIVTTVTANPFDKGKRAEVPQSTRILNPSTNNVRVVEAKPMTVIRTTRRPEVEQQAVKTLDDLEFEKLDIKWTIDYDIITVDQKIIEYLKANRERKNLLRKTIAAYKNYNRPGITTEEISSIKIKMSELTRELEFIEKTSMLDYSIGTSKLVEEYKSLSKVQARIFGQKEKIDATASTRKSEIVQEYLTIANKFCPMNIIRDVRTSGFCTHCNGTISDIGDVIVCNDCDTIQKKMDVSLESNNFEDTSKKTNYESNINFKDIVLQHLTSYPIVIPDRVIDCVKDAASQYEGFDMNAMTKTDLLKIMREQNLGLWYKHLNKIYKVMTGKSPKDISRYTANLFRRGDLLNAIYDKIKPKDRSNFMHGLYLLWLFLKNEKYEPDIDDFILLKSLATEVNNIEILTVGFEMLRKSNPEFEWIIYRLP